MTMPASRGQLRRFSGSNLTAAFCSMCSNASPADWSGWSTFRSVHSSNHNPPQPPLQAWIFTSLTATSVIAVPQAGQFIVMTPSRGCSRYPTTLMAPLRAAQPAGRLARGSRTQSTAGLPESAASTRARRGARVAALEDAPIPQHVVDQQQPTASQLGRDDIERLRVVLLVDIVEDDVEQPRCLLQGRHRLPDVELDDIGQAEDREVLPGLAGQPVVPHDMVHDPSAVFLHRASEPRGRVAEPGAELEDVSSIAETCQQVAQVSRCRADDGKPRAPRLDFQLGEPRVTRGHELVQVRCHASRQEIHDYASITGQSADGISTNCAGLPRASPPARTAAPD